MRSPLGYNTAYCDVKACDFQLFTRDLHDEKEVEKLCFKLMALVALSLGLAANRTLVSGALTVLYQGEVGGLEVERKADGDRNRVKPTPCAYIINVESCEEERDDISALKASGSGPYGLLRLDSNEKEQEECFVHRKNIEKHMSVTPDPNIIVCT
ncbi:hypothetical protein POM88_007730 [Heracleum sosnowskyi]|uniref:Uncharacterized protein n=1 Tax=Heracleum sosnowskyi TaxID=360622 RepID=A0AAD8J554_9APIA|nr:hypothetical protein POM88_007730 [Heracleum sosnowskyi]